MDKIYMNANDKNVAATIIYTDGTYAYFDANYTEKMSEDELFEACTKNCLIRCEGSGHPSGMYTRAIDFSHSYAGYAQVTFYAAYNSGFTTIYSKEYSAPSDDGGHTPT